MTETILDGLLVVSLVCAVLLVLIASATVGRKLADLEYQQTAGTNGIRGIQARINVRTNALRVFLGLTFIAITVLLLADAPLEIRTWVNRTLFMLLLVGYTISAILDWLGEREQMRLLQLRAARLAAESFAAGIKQGSDDALALIAVPPDVTVTMTTGPVGQVGAAGVSGVESPVEPGTTPGDVT